MKNKFTIRAISVAVYFLAVVLWFFIIKDKISTNYRHLVVVAGLIGAVYFIPSSLIKSLREDLPIKRYLIASDIIFYLAFARSEERRVGKECRYVCPPSSYGQSGYKRNS